MHGALVELCLPFADTPVSPLRVGWQAKAKQKLSKSSAIAKQMFNERYNERSTDVDETLERNIGNENETLQKRFSSSETSCLTRKGQARAWTDEILNENWSNAHSMRRACAGHEAAMHRM